MGQDYPVLTFSENEFKIKADADSSLTVSPVTWAKVTNPNPETKDTYPEGYRITGTVSGSTLEELAVGSRFDPPTMFFLSGDKRWLLVQYPHSAYSYITIGKYAKTTLCEVTFDSNGGSAVPPVKVYPDETIARPPNPTQTNRVFDGWYRDNGTFLNEWNFTSDTVGTTAGITLYAKWTETVGACTVTFESNGGTAIDPVPVNAGETLTLPEFPVKEGSVFGGWYNAGALWNPDTPVSTSMTLSAKWYQADSAEAEELGDFDPGAAIHQVFDVTAAPDWNTALTIIRGGGNGRNYIINITADLTIERTAATTFNDVSGLTVSIRGNHIVSISSSGIKGTILNIVDGQAVIVRDTALTGIAYNISSLVWLSGGELTLRGSASVKDNDYSTSSSSLSAPPPQHASGGGVYVAGGTFTMRDSASVSGNTAYSSSGNYGTESGGGGVYVAGGSFIMRDSASVSGNIASSSSGASFAGAICESSGGGVYVVGGTFIMREEASVSGNTAEIGQYASSPIQRARGGGVYVDDFGTFQIEGGTIYGGNEGTNSNNADTSDNALYRYFDSPIQRGTFNGDIFTSKGDLSPGNATIKVSEGELVQP